MRPIPWVVVVVFVAGTAVHAHATDGPAPLVSAEEAAARAINRLSVTTGGIELGHPSHRARFDAAGVEVRPRRGGVRWHWRLAAVDRGGSPWTEVTLTGIEPELGGPGAVVYRRGPLIEEYLAKAGTVEQRFVLSAGTVVDGASDDLVLSGRVESDGRFAVTADGWSWVGDEAEIHLGGVRVFDASGRILGAHMEVGAGHTRIVVAGVDLATAVFPVIVDPEIGANDFRISDMGGTGDADFRGVGPAVAYNSTNNEYLVVWWGDDLGGQGQERFEVFGQRLNATTGAQVGANDFQISSLGPDGPLPLFGQTPAVAYNSTNNEYLVVWSDTDPAGGLEADESEIFGQRLDAATGAQVGADDFRISDLSGIGVSGFHAVHPAVAYNPNDNEYLVVWAGDDTVGSIKPQEFEVFGQRINAATGAAIGTNDFRISDLGGTGNAAFQAYGPAIAHNSINNEYLVVWWGDDNVGGLIDEEFEIFGQRLAADGTEVGANDFLISNMGGIGNTSYAGFAPAVAHNSTNNEYLVAWWGDDTIGSLINDEFEIFIQRIDAATGAAIGLINPRISDMGGIGNKTYKAESPAVAYDPQANEYLVVWESDDNTDGIVALEREIFGQRISGATGLQVGDNDFRISDLGDSGNFDFQAENPAVAHCLPCSAFLVVWDGNDNVGGLVAGEREIFGQLVSFEVHFRDGFESYPPP